MNEKIASDIYRLAMIKVACYEAGYPIEKVAGKFFRVRGQKPFEDPLRKTIKPYVDAVSNNVIMPAVQGFFGSGTAEGPFCQGIKWVTDRTKKWPYFEWTGKWDNVIDGFNRLGKMNVPDNVVAQRINNLAKTLGKYDGYATVGGFAAKPVGTFLGHLAGTFLG